MVRRSKDRGGAISTSLAFGLTSGVEPRPAGGLHATFPDPIGWDAGPGSPGQRCVDPVLGTAADAARDASSRPCAGRESSRTVGPSGGSEDQGGYQTRRDIPATCSLATLPSQLAAGTKDRVSCCETRYRTLSNILRAFQETITLTTCRAPEACGRGFPGPEGTRGPCPGASDTRRGERRRMARMSQRPSSRMRRWDCFCRPRSTKATGPELAAPITREPHGTRPASAAARCLILAPPCGLQGSTPSLDQGLIPDSPDGLTFGQPRALISDGKSIF
jgi:hypothetical protein